LAGCGARSVKGSQDPRQTVPGLGHNSRRRLAPAGHFGPIGPAQVVGHRGPDQQEPVGSAQVAYRRRREQRARLPARDVVRGAYIA
jgi:hypothetical protein